MKRIGFLVSVALVVLVSPFVSAAEPLSEARTQIVRQNCTAAQATMQRVLRSDTAARVNRGRAYEETIKLLAAFNSRAALNTYNVPQLIETTSEYETEFEVYKSTYINYDAAFKEAIRINCINRPADFYEALVRVRELRADLAAHVATLDQLLATYGDGLADVAAQVKAENEAVN